MSGVIPYLSLTVASTRRFSQDVTRKLCRACRWNYLPRKKPYSWCLSRSGCFDGLKEEKVQKVRALLISLIILLIFAFLESVGKQSRGWKSPVAAAGEARGCLGGESRSQRLCAPSAHGLCFASHVLNASQEWEAGPWKCPANMSLQRKLLISWYKT